MKRQKTTSNVYEKSLSVTNGPLFNGLSAWYGSER